MTRRPPSSPLFPSTPLSRSAGGQRQRGIGEPPHEPQHHQNEDQRTGRLVPEEKLDLRRRQPPARRHHAERDLREDQRRDRKSTRLNSSHSQISYAVFCLKKK